MDYLEPASADEAASGPRSSATHSNASTRRKRRSLTQTTSKTGNDGIAVGSTVQSGLDPGQSHLTPQDMTLLELQKSYIRKRAIDSACQEAKLWGLETERLATWVISKFTHNPLASAAAEEWLADRSGLAILSSVASEVTRNIAVCDFDNKLASLMCQHEAFDNNKLSLAMREILADRQTRIGERKSGTAINSNASAAQSRKFYCALVDYVTAVVVKHSYLAADPSWYRFCVTSVARVAAKLKFLSIDSETFASQSLNYARNVVAVGPTRAGELDASNCVRNLSASSWALENLLPIFDDLKFEEIEYLDSFDLGMIIYNIPTSFRSIPTMLSHDRNMQISGTSLKSVIWSTSALLGTLFDVSKTIKVNVADEPLTEVSRQKLLFIELDRRETASSNSGTVPSSLKGYLHTLADVASVMVPLLLMQPRRLLQLNRTSAFGTEPQSFAARDHRFFSTRTEISIFVGLRYSDFFLRSPELIPISALFESLAAQPTFEIEGAQSWVIEERLVVVPRRFYVATTMTACGILVVGGITAGLLVGERIPGVDPFNIATFAWVLAAFIILIAKSLSVREWPWRDFLRGQVPCRSVSELHTVTGIDEQRILKYLLVNDTLTILTTRGPFNTCFTRRSEDGFSIDVKSELRTLMASGIVVVQVSMATGLGLVCLDLRRGIEGRQSINHIDGPQEGERLLGCTDLPEPADSLPGPTNDLPKPEVSELDVQLHAFSRSMTWTRVLGVYSVMERVWIAQCERV